MLSFENISKTFGTKQAVRGLNLEVTQGQVMGLLGPNGAGKSTSMKMAAGCLRPSEGRVRLKGIDVWKKPIQAKQNLGYLPERAPLYEDFTPVEYLRFIAKLRKIGSRDLARSIDQAIDACFLQDIRHQLISTLSKGYRHRVCLAQSLLGDPDILIFDEPTDGLDPNQKQEIRDLIKRIRKDKAIIVSTHILEEVEAICTDVYIMDYGKKVFQGSPLDFRAQSENRSQIVIEFTGGDSQRILTRLNSAEDLETASLDTENGQVVVDLAEGSQTQVRNRILNIFLEENASIVSFSNRTGKTADSFRQLTLPGTSDRSSKA